MSAPLRFARGANDWFWQRVASSVEVPAASLGVFRWIFGLFLLVETPYFAWIDRVPHGLFTPPIFSPAFLLPSFPPSPFFSVLDAVVIASLCCVTVGYRTRLFTVMLVASLLVGFNFRYCFGKADADSLYFIVLVCMEIAGWGNFYSIDSLRGQIEPMSAKAAATRATRGVSLFAVLLAFGMVTAGLEKARSWMDFNLGTSGFLMWFYPQYYDFGRHLLLANWVPRIPIWQLKVGDYLAPTFELSGFAFLLYSRRAWRLWLFIACGFHLVNALLLNIGFNEQALSYLAFVDLSRLTVNRWRHLDPRRMIAGGTLLVGSMGMWHVVSRSLGHGSRVLLVQNVAKEQPFFLYFCIPICAVVLWALARELLARTPPAMIELRGNRAV